MASTPAPEERPFGSNPPAEWNSGSDQPAGPRDPNREPPSGDNSQGSPLLWGIILFVGVAVFGSLIFIGVSGVGGTKPEGSGGASAKADRARQEPAKVMIEPVNPVDGPPSDKPYEPPPLAEELVRLNNASVRGVAVPAQLFKVDYVLAEDKLPRGDTHLYLVLIYPDESRMEFSWDDLKPHGKGTFQGTVTKVDRELRAVLFVEAGSGTSGTRRRVSNYLTVVAVPDADVARANKIPAPPASTQPARPAPRDGSSPKAQAPVVDELGRTLAELKAGSSLAADRLVKTPPVAGRKDEVVKALRAALLSTDDTVRQGAVQAIAVWGGSDSVPSLIPRLQDKSGGVRAAAAEALGGLKDPRAAAALAKLLPGDEGDVAARALAAVGSKAESAVWPYLQFEQNNDAKRRAIRVLDLIGTAASAHYLQEVIRRHEGDIRDEAIKARDSVRTR